MCGLLAAGPVGNGMWREEEREGATWDTGNVGGFLPPCPLCMQLIRLYLPASVA